MPIEAPVAQLDRVTGFEPVGWRFESSRARAVPGTPSEIARTGRACSPCCGYGSSRPITEIVRHRSWFGDRVGIRMVLPARRFPGCPVDIAAAIGLGFSEEKTRWGRADGPRRQPGGFSPSCPRRLALSVGMGGSVVVVERFSIPNIAQTLAERLACRRFAALNRGHHGNEWRTPAPDCVRRKGSLGCLIRP